MKKEQAQEQAQAQAHTQEMGQTVGVLEWFACSAQGKCEYAPSLPSSPSTYLRGATRDNLCVTVMRNLRRRNLHMRGRS